MTTLQAFCKAIGWQGGTIHQAKQRFAVASLAEIDMICSYLSDNIDLITDKETVFYFWDKRREAHILHERGI